MTTKVTTKTGGGWFKKIYWCLVQGENFLGNFLLLIIRLYWGTLLVITGLGKWLHIQGVIDYFSSLNIPLPTVAASSVATLEFLGGLSFFIGFGSRLFSLLLTTIFITAYAIAHQEALAHIFLSPSLFIMQEPFLFLYASLVVLCFGPGLFSLDYWLEKRAFGAPL